MADSNSAFFSPLQNTIVVQGNKFIGIFQRLLFSYSIMKINDICTHINRNIFRNISRHFSYSIKKINNMCTHIYKRGSSNEFPQHMFSLTNKKKKYQYWWDDLFEAILSNFFTFIDLKSRMTQIDSFGA